MNRDMDWPKEYAALSARLPHIVDHAGLVMGGFSACIDVYLALRDTMDPLRSAARGRPEAIALVTELERRAATGVGGEVFLDWPDGPAWLDAHVSGRKAVGGTSAQAGYMLATLGAPALIALEDRSAAQLAVLHPATLVATADGLLPVADIAPAGNPRPPHYIFEFTAGETIGDFRVPRSSRTIVRFDHSALQHDADFDRFPVTDAGAGILSGFNEVPPETAADELDYAARLGAGWRRASLPIVHLELGDFPETGLRDETIAQLLPAANSLGMSRSELVDLVGRDVPPEEAAIRLAEEHGLDRVCVHADEWAFAVTRGDPMRECEALAMGCLLAATRAANGYFAVPDGVPAGARFVPPPLPAITRRGAWSIVCCASPWLERPAATIGLGDTFLAGTLLVLGGRAAAGAIPFLAESET